MTSRNKKPWRLLINHNITYAWPAYSRTIFYFCAVNHCAGAGVHFAPDWAVQTGWRLTGPLIIFGFCGFKLSYKVNAECQGRSEPLHVLHNQQGGGIRLRQQSHQSVTAQWTGPVHGLHHPQALMMIHITTVGLTVKTRKCFKCFLLPLRPCRCRSSQI